MTERRRVLTLEPVEDRCVPSAGGWDHPPPLPAFADHRPHDSAADDHRPGRFEHPAQWELRGEPLMLPRGGPPVFAFDRPGPPAESRAVALDRVEAAAGSAAVPLLATVARLVREDRAALTTRPVVAVLDAPGTADRPPPPAVLERVIAELAAPARPPAVPPTGRTTVDPPTATKPVATSDGLAANPSTPTAATLTPTTADPARPAVAPPAVWAAVPEAPEAPPDEIVLPGVLVEPPTVAAAAVVAREVVAAVAPLVPLVGALPVDLTAVERAADDLLAGLTEAADLPTAGRWGWAGLAVLAAGGLVHALRPAADRRAATAVGNDSALARWESRHARPPA